MTVYSLSASDTPDNIRYIGITSKPCKIRLREHKSESRRLVTRKDKWIKSVLNRGESVVINDVDHSENFNDLKKLEMHYIRMFKSFGARLVNGTGGGDGAYGVVRTKEQKIEMGKYAAKEVYMFEYKTKELVCKYPSTLEMCRQNNFTINQVSNVLSGKQSYHKGFTFSKTNVCPDEIKRNKVDVWNKGVSTKGKQRFNTSPVELSFNGQKTTFNTVGELAAHLKIHHSQINVAIKFRAGRYKGFVFRYATEAMTRHNTGQVISGTNYIKLYNAA